MRYSRAVSSGMSRAGRQRDMQHGAARWRGTAFAASLPRRAAGRVPRDRAHRRAPPCGARCASAPVRPGPGCPRCGRCGLRRARRVSAPTTLPLSCLDGFVNAARGGGGVAFDGEERLGHCDRNLAGVERRHRAVAADDLIGARRPATKFGTQLRGRERLWLRARRVEKIGHRQTPDVVGAGCHEGRCIECTGDKAPAWICKRPPGHPARGRFLVSRQVSWLAGRRFAPGLPNARRISDVKSGAARRLQLRGQRRILAGITRSPASLLATKSCDLVDRDTYMWCYSPARCQWGREDLCPLFKKFLQTSRRRGSRTDFCRRLEDGFPRYPRPATPRVTSWHRAQSGIVSRRSAAPGRSGERRAARNPDARRPCSPCRSALHSRS